MPQPPAARYFPPPWTIEEANAACFIVRDVNGQGVTAATLKDSNASARKFLEQFSAEVVGVDFDGVARRF